MTAEADAFHSLYRRHAPAVWRFVRSLRADSATADDLVAEAFARAWTAAAPLREESVKAYLFTIARNLHRLSSCPAEDRIGDFRLTRAAASKRPFHFRLASALS